DHGADVGLQAPAALAVEGLGVFADRVVDAAAGLGAGSVERGGDGGSLLSGHRAGPEGVDRPRHVLDQAARLRLRERRGGWGDPAGQRDLLAGAAALFLGL